MEKNEKKVREEILNLSSKSFEDSNTYEKVHRHLRDINDVISEEDISNVRTDIFSVNRNAAGEEEKALIIKNAKEESSKEDMDDAYDEGKKISSSWNILSE